MATILLSLLLAAGTAPPPPPEPLPEMLCPAPPAFAAWDRPYPLVAGSGMRGPPLPSMTMGQAAAVTLAPGETFRPVVPPGREGGPATYAGLLRVSAPVAGTYRFALGDGAWLDVVDAVRPAVASAHGHGPVCGPVRKLVDLPLSAGDHIVQIADAPTPNLTILAIRVR